MGVYLDKGAGRSKVDLLKTLEDFNDVSIHKFTADEFRKGKLNDPRCQSGRAEALGAGKRRSDYHHVAELAKKLKRKRETTVFYDQGPLPAPANNPEIPD